ncbi:MAG: hypothetical protein Q7T55_00255 [Solirubrobacteraceae bacterium]|nr:hypothetical protein [Solirubrobacteraceae bacterium]
MARRPPPPPQRGMPPAEWYSVRRAVNAKPSTYRCPFCGERFPALIEHVLVAPLGDTTLRRHAHTQCTLRARADGSLPSREEWRSTQPKTPSWLSRLLRRG